MNTLNTKLTKVDAVCEWVNEHIDNQVYLVGQRLPSVRKLSQQLGTSTFTVSQAYEKLVIAGTLTSRRGSGYFVAPFRESNATVTAINDKMIDATWLMKHMFASSGYQHKPGSGEISSDWIRYERMPTIVRQVANTVQQTAYQTPHSQGLLALREQYSLRMKNNGIQVSANELITIDGVSSAITLIVRYLLKPNDTVIVDNPCWFWLTANLQTQGVRVFEVDRDAEGPNIEQLENILKHHNAKLYVTNSVMHNPTGYNIHPARAYQVLNLMHQYDAYLLEDDIYKSYDDDAPALRYCTLDRERVFYSTGVSKILGMDWRQAIISAPKAHHENLLQHKMLTHMTNSVYLEKTVLGLLTDLGFRKHSQLLIKRLHNAHEQLRLLLKKYGFEYQNDNYNGFFVWLDTGCDSAKLALTAKQQGFLVAPGQLFSVKQKPSTYIRLNVSQTNESFLQWLSEYRDNYSG